MKNKKRIKYAFTLAEVLITLVIIGIIAAISVPSLINKTNNQETVSKLKKAYSTLSQVTNQIIAEEGAVKSWSTSMDNVYYLYKKKLLNAKECGNNSGCFEQGAYKYLNNTGTSSVWDSSSNRYKLIINDGIQIMFSDLNNNCTSDNAYGGGTKNLCFAIAVDINGKKKPNTVARDLFSFAVKKDGLYPAGCDYDGLCNKEQSGYACACKVLREGAINY